ncbi:Protein of unknown function [Pyronema omphalodes CBS 100304]|uniref:Uncharacterized protein n=1 Tax=Pyronema omphalodes (strain CBS 100304) TaxID=1076935 RepID=U4L3D4_PYROM|nr:Protein of unknown function [Pyronema omphalodes CBS 100304]
MDGAGARSLEYIRVLLAWWRAFGPACPGWVDESYRTSERMQSATLICDRGRETCTHKQHEHRKRRQPLLLRNNHGCYVPAWGCCDSALLCFVLCILIGFFAPVTGTVTSLPGAGFC